MQTGTTIPWDFLFAKNGKSTTEFKENIIELLGKEAKFCDTISISLVPTTSSGVYLFYDQGKPLRIGKSTGNLREAVRLGLKRINGHAPKTKVAIVRLPPKVLALVWDQLKLLERRKRLENPLAEKLMRKEFPTENFLRSCLNQVPFHLICSRDETMPSGCFVHPLPSVKIDSSGPYFIEERNPDGSSNGIVYAGISKANLKSTIKGHFWTHYSKSDFNPTTGNLRGEIKGDWIRKVAEENYSYHVAAFTMLPPIAPSHLRSFYDKLFHLERLFIELLDPRDNTRKKINREPSLELFEETDSPSNKPKNEEAIEKVSF